jgi:hypothetical protein
MRYFFHAAGRGSSYNDENGTIFESDEAAMVHAAVIARELSEDGSLDGFAIVVVSETGVEIGRVPIAFGRAIVRSTE